VRKASASFDRATLLLATGIDPLGFAKVDEKAASKWAAALEMADLDRIAPKHFLAFLREIGGIEGCTSTAIRITQRPRSVIHFAAELVRVRRFLFS
jgi:hypothetical protein